MRTLLYCVWAEPTPGRAPAAAPRVAGVGAAAVEVLSAAGIAAATSPIDEAELIPSLARIRAYEDVVEAFFDIEPAVVPMRYGSSFEDPRRAREFLAGRAERFKAQLAELEGSVELGIRAQLSSPRAEAREAEAAPAPPVRAQNAQTRAPSTADGSDAPGRAYLSGLRQRYQSARDPGQSALIERLAQSLNALSRRMKVEDSPALAVRPAAARGAENDAAGGQSSSFSLYFLVPREGVAAFRARYEQLARGERARLQLTGPWPPYNFVVA